MNMYKIGIDVGGTNTDAVIIDESKTIIAKTKQLTTADISEGIGNALNAVISQVSLDLNLVSHVMLGTTHCTNALIEREKLNKIAHFRIGTPSAQAISPLPDWPKDLSSKIVDHIFQIEGGFEFDGRPIGNFNEEKIVQILKSIENKISAISVAGVFSKIDSSQEIRGKELVEKVLGQIPVSMSHQIGGLGLLERENATVINSALMDIASHMVDGFREAVSSFGIEAKLYISQNDGSLMSLDQAKKFPVLTISSGPTNSLRGASALSNLDNAIVIDIGGTTSDAGILVNGFPRESNKHSDIGGVRTNFRMPDILSIGIGGGTIVNLSDGKLEVGPKSVGFDLTNKALCFGGDTLTLTDIAIIQEKMIIKGASISGLNFNGIIPKVESIVQEEIEKLIDLLKTDPGAIPIVLVGGGSAVLPDMFEGASSIIRPENGEVANAYGVAIASISGESEIVVNLNEVNRDDAIREVTESAKRIAITSGAEVKSIKIVDLSDSPLAYLPNTTKIKVKVLGDLI